MAIKKSELYSTLWAGCDELRGSMDASQYKNYVLVLLFMKYVSDKVRREAAMGEMSIIDMPVEASFYDMLKYRNTKDIGDKINTIIAEFANANELSGIINPREVDFNDDSKFGQGKEKIDTLTNLLNIFNRPELDFSNNRAEGDDLLGDAYEYLMRNFATQSGKSKGQFYTPAEVSRIMAQVIGVDKSISKSQTIYDPACGSGSLLLKAADVAPKGITIYGQEKDNATRALAVMNMWLHNFSDAEIAQGNTIAAPEFKNETESGLKQFDFAVANPPFSLKKWSAGIVPEEDDYKRFDGYSIPPAKNGDYAFLLHVIKSLKSTGKACIVLPLGVLFRGNSEAEIRKQIIKKGYIKGIISLPANLFFGTGIAAALIIIDKEGASERDSIFMIDASKGFVKDGNKNRLREQDIHKIVTTFNRELVKNPKYARRVPIAEISNKKNNYNLNIPRYIDSADLEDMQDIEAHLKGGIPRRDVDFLSQYWEVYPTLRDHIFTPISGRENFYVSNFLSDEISSEIYHYPEFVEFSKQMQAVYSEWGNETVTYCYGLDKNLLPKAEIKRLSESLLSHYAGRKLVDKYSVYQIIMDYWKETMQDDLYVIAADGWSSGNEYGYLSKIKKDKTTGDETSVPIKGLYNIIGRIIPASLLIAKYFGKEQKEIDTLSEKTEHINSKKAELLEENGEQGQVLFDVSSKASAEKALLEAVISAMEIYSKSIANKYNKLKTQAESNENLLDAYNTNNYFYSLRAKSGSVSSAAVNARLKIATDRDEIEVLQKYSDTVKLIAKIKREQKAEYEKGYKIVEAQIAKVIEDELLDDVKIAQQYLALLGDESASKDQLKKVIAKLEKLVVEKYPALSIEELKKIVIEDKWMADLSSAIQTEMDSISHSLTSRITTLTERYAEPMPSILKEVTLYENKVIAHLEKMGFTW